MIVGYTSGVFDLFHVGHLNILKNAKSVCDKLIVGVTTDEYVMTYKGKKPVIEYSDRAAIVESVRYVDLVVPQHDHNKMSSWREYNFNVMIVGDDWKNTAKWNAYEEEFAEVGVKIFYFPRTEHVSSSELRSRMRK